MSAPEPILFDCIACGGETAEVSWICAACQESFRVPRATPTEALADAVAPPDRQETPASPSARPARTIRISTLLIWIAVLGICLSGFHENTLMGTATTISLVPPALWTSFHARGRRFTGRPMKFAERFETFWVAMFATWFMVFSCVYIFIMLCYLIFTLAGRPGLVPISCSIVGTFAYAAWITSLFIRSGRRRAMPRRKASSN